MKSEVEELRKGMVELGIEDRLYRHVKSGKYIFRLCDNAVLFGGKPEMNYIIFQSCHKPFQVMVMDEESFFDGRYEEDMSEEALLALKKLVEFRSPSKEKNV